MIYDHRTYTCRPGTIKKHLELYLEHGWEPQTRNLGKPLLYAMTETGDPNSYVHVWVYEDAADRAFDVLKQFDAVLILERLSVSFRQLAYKLDWCLPATLNLCDLRPKHCPAYANLDEVRDAFGALNAPDAALYEKADRLAAAWAAAGCGAGCKCGIPGLITSAFKPCHGQSCHAMTVPFVRRVSGLLSSCAKMVAPAASSDAAAAMPERPRPRTPTV